MGVATMSFASDISTPIGVFVPATPLVVKRDKRVRRRKQRAAREEEEVPQSKRRAVRQGFVFDATHEDEIVPASQQSVASTSFAFSVRKSPHKAEPQVDADSVTAALLQKQQRAQQLEEKRKRLEEKKQAMEKEEQFELVLIDEFKLSDDQMHLFYAVRDQIKRELRKTRRDFATSAGRNDIIALTEKSVDAVKYGIAEFMTTNPPSQARVTVPNPENARLKAFVESYEARIKELETEESQWKTVKESIVSATTADGESKETESPAELQPILCELNVTKEIGDLQKAAIAQIETSALRLVAIEDSMRSIDRLILQAEIKQSDLFDAFHGSAFKGYLNMEDPKETLRSLLKLAPTSK